jgi:glycosyltransferase involved in cell wall biosynthesis
VNELPLVSVIMPVYNGAQYVRETIESVFAQTYPHIEFIAVDDGSTDDSLDILNCYASRMKVIQQTNSGPGAARNNGVQASTGELLAFIDSDDLWDSTKIERQVATLTHYPEAVAVYCETRRIDSSGNVFQDTEAYRCSWPSGLIFESLIRGRSNVWFSPTQVMVTRQAFIRAGSFPVDIRQAEDHELWLRLSLEGPMLYMIENLTSYRRHPASLSVSPDSEFGRQAAHYRILDRLVKDAASDPRIKPLTLIHAELAERATALAYFARKKGDYSRAVEAYQTALRLKPRAIGLWMRLLITLFSRLAPTRHRK